MDPFRWCVFCQVDCTAAVVEHAAECPSRTGVYPVDVDMRCARCRTLLRVGEDVCMEEKIGAWVGIPVFQRVCLGCAAGAWLG